MNKKRLKILFVARDKFPPFRVDVSVLFGKEMASKGHRIDWVLQSESDCKKSHKTKWDGGDAWVGSTNNGNSIIDRSQKHLRGFLHNVFCLRLMLRRKYDIVQVKDRIISSLVFLAFAKIKRIKFFYWLSYPFAEASLYEYRIGSARYPLIYLLRGILYKIILYKIVMKHADHIFVQSEQMKLDICSEGIIPQKMTPIPMGIEDGSFVFDTDDDRRRRRSANRNNVIYIGTLNKLRKLDFVVRMFAKIVDQIPDAKLYLVGRADAEEDIELLRLEAARLNITESIIFTGFLERGQVFEIVDKADVCISPFYPTPVLNSTSPTKLIEYMASGKSVVANDHPEQKIVIEQSGAGICVPYRESDFADAVIYILTHPDINESMGKKGRDWVRTHRVYSKIANDVENEYYKQSEIK